MNRHAPYTCQCGEVFSAPERAPSDHTLTSRIDALERALSVDRENLDSRITFLTKQCADLWESREQRERDHRDALEAARDATAEAIAAYIDFTYSSPDMEKLAMLIRRGVWRK